METLQRATQNFRRVPENHDSSRVGVDTETNKLFKKMKKTKGLNLYDQNLTGVENLIKESVEVCIEYMRWEIEELGYE